MLLKNDILITNKDVKTTTEVVRFACFLPDLF